MRVVVENGDIGFFRSLSSEHTRDATVDDLGDISRSLDCLTSNISAVTWFDNSTNHRQAEF